jgi:hypothetical protein
MQATPKPAPQRRSPRRSRVGAMLGVFREVLECASPLALSPARKLGLALLLLVPLVTLRAASLEETYAAQGRLIVTQFVSAPFPHPTRAAGHTYKEKLYSAAEHYADSSVAIFVPNGFRDTGRADFVIHFHGWNNTVGGTLAGYQLIEQLMASGKNAILIVPEGPRNAPDSFGGKLEDADGFKRFIEELMTTLKQRSVLQKESAVGNIILSGHSGGYRVISAILDRGGMAAQVKEVWLFDALYAETPRFLGWYEKHPGRLINIYTDGGGTKDDSEAMMALLKERKTSFVALEETNATPTILKTNQLLFLHTDLGHNDVVAKRKQFGSYLETSCLEGLR